MSPALCLPPPVCVARVICLFLAALALPGRQAQSNQPSQSNPVPAPPETKPEDLCIIEGQATDIATGAPVGKAKVTYAEVSAPPPARRSQTDPRLASGHAHRRKTGLRGRVPRLNVLRASLVRNPRRTPALADPGTPGLSAVSVKAPQNCSLGLSVSPVQLITRVKWYVNDHVVHFTR
jgi:hypothetical protein